MLITPAVHQREEKGWMGLTSSKILQSVFKVAAMELLHIAQK